MRLHEYLRALGIGRGRLAREAGITEWRARKLLSGKERFTKEERRAAERLAYRELRKVGIPRKVIKSKGFAKRVEYYKQYKEAAKKIAEKYDKKVSEIMEGWYSIGPLPSIVEEWMVRYSVKLRIREEE